MSFSVDMSGVGAKLDAIAKDRGLGQVLAAYAAAGMDPYVPFRTGALAGSAVASPFTVRYMASYATYPFHGRNMTIRTEHHPLATLRWDRAYAIEHGQELGDVGTQYLRGQA